MTETAAELPPPGAVPTGGAGLPRGKPIGYAMVIAGAVLFSVNGSVSKVALSSGIDSLSLVLLRCAGCAVTLLVLVLLIDRSRMRVNRSEWPLLIAYGVVAIAMVQWLYFVAIARLPVGIALLLEFTAPLMVALWAKFVQHKNVRRGVWLALALVLGGLALVAQVWDGMTLDVIGVLAALLAAVALASYFVMGEHAVGERDTVSLAMWAFVIATVFWSIVHPWWTVPWSALDQSVSLQGALSSVSVPAWVLVAWIALLGTVAPFLLEIGALRHVPATRAGIVATAEPVIAAFIAWVWLGEVLAPVQIVGALVVVAGVALAQVASG
jgi:drug/metabolite transporter (DMT)-like permease